MKPSIFLCSIASLSVIGGCTDDTDATGDLGVADLAKYGGHLSVVGGHAELRVTFEDYEQQPHACVTLRDDVTAALPGSIVSIERGGPGSPGADGCRPPQMRFLSPRSHQPALVITDGDTSVTCDLEDAVDERTITIESPGGWVFRPGQRVTAQWSPATDFDASYLFGVRMHALHDHNNIYTVLESKTEPGGRVTFDIPNEMPERPQELLFTAYTDGSRTPRQIHCGSLDARLDVKNEIVQAITFAP